MNKKLNDILNILDNAPDEFFSNLTRVEKNVYDKIVIIIKELDIDPKGNIKVTVANLKKLTSIKGSINKALLSEKYISSITEYIDNFLKISNLQNALFGIDKPFLKKLQETAINNTIDVLSGKSFTESMTNAVRKIIQTSIVSGGSYSKLTDDLKKEIVTDKESDGLIQKYAKTYVGDTLSIYSRQYMKAATDNLGYEWYQYVGSNIKTTRCFCLKCTEKRYIHISEFKTLLTGDIDGKQCPLGKNGLPLGMYDDTTPDNFTINAGGWNCRHIIYPVSKVTIPKEIVSKLEI